MITFHSLDLWWNGWWTWWSMSMMPESSGIANIDGEMKFALQRPKAILWGRYGFIGRLCCPLPLWSAPQTSYGQQRIPPYNSSYGGSYSQPSAYLLDGNPHGTYNTTTPPQSSTLSQPSGATKASPLIDEKSWTCIYRIIDFWLLYWINNFEQTTRSIFFVVVL